MQDDIDHFPTGFVSGTISRAQMNKICFKKQNTGKIMRLVLFNYFMQSVITDHFFYNTLNCYNTYAAFKINIKQYSR